VAVGGSLTQVATERLRAELARAFGPDTGLILLECKD
jgi:hypothetical protein